MIKYSILDNSKQELSSNVTIRLDDSDFKNTIITYDPIKLVDDKIVYSIIFHSLYSDGIEMYGSIDNAITLVEKEKLMDICFDIFGDLLKLFNGEIKYDT